jgi:hypothetical protein
VTVGGAEAVGPEVKAAGRHGLVILPRQDQEEVEIGYHTPEEEEVSQVDLERDYSARDGNPDDLPDEVPWVADDLG